jgi:hypothetical protein
MLTLPTSIDRADIEAFVTHITNEVMEGNADPLNVHIRCKAVVKALEAIIERTEELAKDVAANYGKGEFKFSGASVQLREPRDMPDFAQDAVCVEITERLKARQELVKTAFKMAGTAAIVDPTTGEVVPVVPVKPAKTTLTVTFR